MSSASPLHIAVVGVGSIGSAFAYQLAHAGHDVSVVARPGSVRLQQLQRDGAIVLADGKRATVHVSDHIDEETEYDILIVTAMAHQLPSILPALRRCRAKRLQFMFNNFAPEHLRDEFGAERCVFGMPFVMSSTDGDGKVNASISTSSKTLIGDQRVVDIFNAAGIHAQHDADMILWLRCHVPFGAALESICVTAQRNGGGASWAQSMVVARGFQEGLALVKHLGFTLRPSSLGYFRSMPTFLLAAMLWSICRVTSVRVLLATGEAECRALIDVMVAAGRKAQPPMATAAIEAMKPAIQADAGRSSAQ